METWIVRLLAISGLIFAGFITFTAYIAAWFLLDKKPVTLYSQEDVEFAEVRDEGAQLAGWRHTSSGPCPHRPGAGCTGPRVQRIEKLVTSKEFTLQREFSKL